MFEYKNLIEVNLNKFKAIQYTDYFCNEKFFNIEIYKNNKCLRHITIGSPMNEIELSYYLKLFIKNISK